MTYFLQILAAPSYEISNLFLKELTYFKDSFGF